MSGSAECGSDADVVSTIESGIGAAMCVGAVKGMAADIRIRWFCMEPDDFRKLLSKNIGFREENRLSAASTDTIILVHEAFPQERLDSLI